MSAYLASWLRATASLSIGGFAGSLAAVLALVAVPVLLLGMVAPYANRLAVARLDDTGTVTGRLYAISTAGSLVGTFLAALLLIPLIGTHRTFLVFAVMLAIAGAVGAGSWRFLVVAGAIAALLAVPPAAIGADVVGARVIFSTETYYQYARVLQFPTGERWLELNEGLAVHSVYLEVVPVAARQVAPGASGCSPEPVAFRSICRHSRRWSWGESRRPSRGSGLHRRQGPGRVAHRSVDPALCDRQAMTLITVEELREALAGEPPALLDVRWELGGPPGREVYLEGHIPGAVFVDLDTALAGPPGAGGRHPLPDPEAFTRAMRAAGVSRDRPVVVYDAGNSIAAARAWWVLRYFGHSRVRVLDGGFGGWLAAGYAIERAVTSPEPGDFVASAGGMPLLDAAAAAALAKAGVLIDARAPERFRGVQEPIDPVAGHVPGAVNLPASALVGANGRLLSPDVLRARFSELGVNSGASVGAYCGSGVAASYEVLALELAGYSGALYIGSWSDWVTDPDRPVAKGE